MKRLLVLGLLIPAGLFGQKTNDLIIALQRDMSSLQEQMKTLQKTQDDRLGAIQTMLQQAVDASKGASSSIAALQREVDTKLNDQQMKLVAPVATLGTKVDQMSDEFRAVGSNVTDLRAKINALDTKLADISNAIRVLTAPPPPVPPSTSSAQVPADPCAGVSGESLWENARRDKSKGDLQDAMTEYMNYAKCFHDTANAPVAQFEIGMMYFNNGQSDPTSYEQAVKAFDAALEFPENPKKPEALYFKGVSLFRAGQKTEAGKVFKDYIAHYPHGDHVAAAHTNLKSIGMDTPSRKR
jgi:TolA-binding protein